MGDLDALEQAFGADESPPERAAASVATTSAVVTASFDKRFASLVRADGGKYERCLNGGHAYPSDSEASLAVVDAMVARHFTDGEIWAALEPSALFRTRVEKKGELHARNLYQNEIAKARQVVTPFPRDPVERVVVRVVAAPVPEPEVVSREQPKPLALPQGNDWVSRYVRYGARRTDAPLEAHELMAVLTLSALAGPGPRIPIATARRGWNFCLWGMYIVNSTVGRKTTVLSLAKDILSEVLSPQAILEWEGSPQGLIQRLEERDGQSAAFVRDEYSGLMAQMNRSGGHMAGLSQMFIKAFDGGVLENIRTKKKRTKDGPKEEDTDRVERPYLTKLTAATWDSMLERCTIDNVLDGYLARFIFVTGAAEPQPLPRLTAEMESESDALVGHAHQLHMRASTLDVVEFDDSIVRMAWDLEQRWLRHAQECTRPDAAGPSMKRLAESVFKTAGLLAIDQAVVGEPVVITEEHFAAAEEMGERWKSSTIQVIEGLGSTSFMRETEAVLRTIAARPQGVPVRDVSRSHRRIRKREFDEILDTLTVREQIEIVSHKQERGRPKEVAYPFGHAPDEQE